MATIVKRRKSFYVVHYVRNSDGVRKQKWETYHSLEDAQERKFDLETPNPFIGDIPRARTFGELVNEYVRLYGKNRWSVSSYAMNTSLIERYIKPLIGNIPLGRIDPRFMSYYFDKLSETEAVRNKYKPQKTGCISQEAQHQVYKLLRSIFNQATEWGYYAVSPVKHISIPKPYCPPIEFLTAEQVINVINAATRLGDMRTALAIQFAFVTSLRKGELLALKWQDINTDDLTIKINKELVRVSYEAIKATRGKNIFEIYPSQKKDAKTRLVLKSPKTRSSIRTVYMPQPMREFILRWKQEQNPQSEEELVFCNAEGLPYQEKELSKCLDRLLEFCGYPRVVFHSLRHSSTTYKLKLSGGNIKAVQGDNGHAKPNMVLNVYARILDDDRKMLANHMEHTLYTDLMRN